MQEGTLVNRIYRQQLALAWPGLATEVAVICEEIGIENINLRKTDKKTIEEAVFHHNYMEMKKRWRDTRNLRMLGMESSPRSRTTYTRRSWWTG